MLTVEEVILRSEQGVLRPFLCKADNGKRYFVKGKGAGYQALINEFVAGSLGRMFELPIPPFEVIHIPPELVAESAFPKIRDLGHGPAFASQLIEYAQEFSGGNRPRVAQEVRAKTFLFDWWIMNQDRILVDSAGNPNLLWVAQDQTMHVIDHNLAFDPEFDRDTLLSLVLIGNGCNLFWYGENHVEVLGIQKLGLAILEPLSPGQRLAFGTVAIGTGVISVALMATLITLLHVATQNSSPADLDCSHDAMLRHRHRSTILQAIICAVAAEYIRYFQPRAIHFPPSLYKCRGRVGIGSASSVCGSRSSGLLVEHTFVVAMRR